MAMPEVWSFISIFVPFLYVLMCFIVKLKFVCFAVFSFCFKENACLTPCLLCNMFVFEFLFVKLIWECVFLVR